MSMTPTEKRDLEYHENCKEAAHVLMLRGGFCGSTYGQGFSTTKAEWPHETLDIAACMRAMEQRLKDAESQLAAMQARAERAEGLLAGRKTYWPHDADGDQGSDDLDAICDEYEIGDTFSVQVALMLPDEYYVMQVNDKGQSDPLPATPEEIEALKAERRAKNARRKAEFDRINAERFKPVKAVPIDTARSEAGRQPQ
jgi:hypothetical protein